MCCSFMDTWQHFVTLDTVHSSILAYESQKGTLKVNTSLILKSLELDNTIQSFNSKD